MKFPVSMTFDLKFFRVFLFLPSLFLLIQLSDSGSIAKGQTVDGHVIDSKNKPVEHVRVELIFEENSNSINRTTTFRVYTDKKGYFSVTGITPVPSKWKFKLNPPNSSEFEREISLAGPVDHVEFVTPSDESAEVRTNDPSPKKDSESNPSTTQNKEANKPKTYLMGFNLDGKLIEDNILVEVKKFSGGTGRIISPTEGGVYSLEALGFSRNERIVVTPVSPDLAETPITVNLKDGVGKFQVSPRYLSAKQASNQKYESPGVFNRAIIGFEQTGASSTPSSTNFFLNLYSVRALEKTHSFFLWGDLRLTTLPSQQRQGVVKDSFSSFSSTLLGTNVNEAVNSASFLIGAQYRIPKVVRVGNIHFYTSLVAGFGGTTPINPPTSVIEGFDISKKEIRQRLVNYANQPNSAFKLPAGFTADTPDFDKLAFVPQERNRFFRQYFGGVRFETFYLDNKTLPAIIDIGFGQNEGITGGRLKGGVMRFDAFFPLGIPARIGAFSFDGAIYIYGTALMRTTKSVASGNSLILPRFDGSISVGDPKLLLISLPQQDRDFYRIGAGVDLIQLIRNAKKPKT